MNQHVSDFLAELTQEVKEELYNALESQLFGVNVLDIENVRSNQLSDKPISCPYCNSLNITGHGTYRTRRRFRCRECSKTFNEVTGTPLANLKKVDEFCEYLRYFSQELTLKQCANKFGISIKTAFDWRHKILAAISSSSQGHFEGIVESDDKQFEFSEKGRRDLEREPYNRPSDRDKSRGNTNKKVTVVVSSDRDGNSSIKLTKFGRIDKKSLDAIFENKLTSENILCTDSHYSYKGWAKDNRVEHHCFTANKKQHVKDKVYHVQHVNSIDNKLVKWLSKFWGVATKYLQGYLDWFRIKDKLKHTTNTLEALIEILTEDNKAWLKFSTIEIEYQKHLKNRRFL